MHGREDLDVAVEVEPEFGRDASDDEVNDERGGRLGGVRAGVLGRFAGEPVEVEVAGELWGLAAVNAVGVGDDAGLLCLAEDRGQAHLRDALGGELVALDLAGAD